MRFLLFLTAILIGYIHVSATSIRQTTYLKETVILNDTVFVDDTPYCIFKQQDNGYVISTLDIGEIMYIQPFTKNKKRYYKISISPLRETYYAEQANGSISSLVNDIVNYQLVEDNFFSAYGANTLIKEKLETKKFILEWELPKTVNPHEILKQHISYKATPNEDSVVILADGIAVAYYSKKNWRDYGVDRLPTLLKTNATYRYFIYRTGNDEPLAEVRVVDWWQTKVTIITPDGWSYQFQNTPDTKDMMRVATKLVLLRETLEK